jgi:lipoyl-dependent peroxiredoxin
MALALRLGEHKAVPERLAITATVTLDEAGGVPTIVSSHLHVTATVPESRPGGIRRGDCRGQRAVPGVPAVRRGAKITVDAALEPAA